MISFGRPLVGKEKIFLNPDYRVYVQYAFQVENPKDLPPLINKLKKSTSGLYIKSDGYNFLYNFKDEESVTVHRIPKKINNLSECCDWIYRAFTPDVNYSLACLSICAKNKIFGPIGVETVVDFRRLIDRKRVNYRFGNAYTNFALCITKPNPKMTIGEICSEFRNKFNHMKENDWFFKEFLFPVEFKRDFCPAAHVSNVGPVRIKSPLKDLYMQVSAKEMGSRSYMQVTSYSKHKKETGENVFVLHMGYSPVIVSHKNADDIFKTYIHFLKTANPEKKVGDVLDELIHFQQSLL